MRVGIFYRGLSGSGGYPGDFLELASSIEGLGHQVIRYSRPDASRAVTALRTNRDSLDLLHIVGVYLPVNFRVAAAARSGGIPYVCSLLGQHAPALVERRKTLRKRLFLKGYSRWVVGGARAVHYFSSWERDLPFPVSSSVLGFDAGMGVPPPEFREPDRIPGEGFVFFGRNDVYQKGLDVLLAAFARSLPSLGKQGRLTIAGRHDGDSARTLSEHIERLGLRGRVRVEGPSKDESPIGRARVFVYPSRYDGPPRPPRAALAMGIPVLVTRSTNLGDGVAAYDAGWVAEPTIESLADALTRAAKADDMELARKSQSASALAERWSWSRVAQDYVAGYEACLSGSDLAER